MGRRAGADMAGLAMSWASTPIDAVRVFAEPGDMTRYEFVVIPCDRMHHVIKTTGSPFAESFSDWQLRELAEYSSDVIKASYDEYGAAASNNDYVTNVIFPLAAERNHNAWTFLAAMFAALLVSNNGGKP
jgi:hypothetical protein